jgi:hypothetical protein
MNKEEEDENKEIKSKYSYFYALSIPVFLIKQHSTKFGWM